MARQKKILKNSVISIRVSDAERDVLQEIMKHSHCKSMSDFMRTAFRLATTHPLPFDAAFTMQQQGGSHEKAQCRNN